MKIFNHRLEGENLKIQGSPNRGGPLKPDTVVVHYTASPSAESAIRTLCDPGRKASAHVVIDFDGSITQLVPFNIISWHAGKSRHEDRVGLNKYSIGIEIVNAGKLVKSGSNYVSWFGKKFPAEDVFYGIHRNEEIAAYWHQYTQEQIATVEELCSLLIAEYNMFHILGHEEISPGRKIDPGPAFPLDKLRNRILALSPRDEEGEEEPGEIPAEGLVTASKLNIRSGPTTAHIKVARALPKGKKVKILQKSGDWYRVSTNVEGWVSGQYIEEA